MALALNKKFQVLASHLIVLLHTHLCLLKLEGNIVCLQVDVTQADDSSKHPNSKAAWEDVVVVADNQVDHITWSYAQVAQSGGISAIFESM